MWLLSPPPRFRTTGIIPLSWRRDVWNQGVSRALLPLRRQGEAFPPRPVSALPAAPGVPGLADGHRPLVSSIVCLCDQTSPLRKDSSHWVRASHSPTPVIPVFTMMHLRCLCAC